MAPRRSLEKLSRRAGVELGLKGARQVAGKSGRIRRPYPPGQQGRLQQGRRRKRDSDYLLQLKEKQKLQWFYGVPAGQLRRYVEASRRQPQATGEALLRELEVIADRYPEVWLVDGQCALALGDPSGAVSLGKRYLE